MPLTRPAMRPDAGAGVADVDDLGRLTQGPAGDVHAAVGVGDDRGTDGRDRSLRVEHVSTVREPGDVREAP